MKGKSEIPLISIIIPTFNQANYLPLAINSCLSQTYPRLEIIVSDDCSSDSTAEVMTQFSDYQNIFYYRQTENLGRVGNYRKLLNEYASGEWVLNLDGDDYYNEDTFVERALKTMSTFKSEDVVFIMSGKRVVNTMTLSERIRPVVKKNRIVSGKDYFKNEYFSLDNFSHSAAIFRRSAAKKVGFYTFDSVNTDAHSFLRLSLSGKVILLEGTPLSWVIHGDNQSNLYSFGENSAERAAMEDVAKYASSHLTKEEVQGWLVRLDKREQLRDLNHKFKTLHRGDFINYLSANGSWDVASLKLFIKAIIGYQR